MVQRPLDLRSYTTMKIGGRVERLVWASELQAGMDLPRPIRLLGNGSNILIDDRGLKGTVVIVRDLQAPEPEIIDQDGDSRLIRVSAGLYLPTLSAWALKNGLSGCEYMVGIPGTVGGALVQNAGAHEQDFSMIVQTAEVFNIDTAETKVYSASDLKLTYRRSRLKDDPQWLVRSATIRLREGEQNLIQQRIQKNLEYRKTKTPMTKASLGSVYTRLARGDSWLYPGQLIEAAGLKGLHRGDACISPVHANYIVNEGRATFDDVLELMETIEARVFEHSGAKLQREILVWSDRLQLT